MIIEKRKELQQEMDKLAEIMTSDLERRLPELNLSENLEKLAERELKEKEKKEKNFQQEVLADEKRIKKRKVA